MVELYEDKQGTVKFYFTHSDKNFTTGVMVLKPQSEIPKHNRPLAVESLVQISGRCVMKLFKNENDFKEKELKPGGLLAIPKGQRHIHSNPFNEESVTLFKAEGDITEIMATLRSTFNKINL